MPLDARALASWGLRVHSGCDIIHRGACPAHTAIGDAEDLCVCGEPEALNPFWLHYINSYVERRAQCVTTGLE